MNVDKLNQYVDGFISEKRTLGYKYKTEEYKIKSFARFVQDNNVGNCLSKEGMLLWTDIAKTPLARNSRISILRQYSFPLILRMLYGCGLRILEALSLKLKQVDLQKGTLLIENTKFFKDRRVPMHANSTKKVF